MTIWTKFLCTLERCYYDIRLSSGYVIRHIWPLIRQGKPDTFSSHEVPVVAEWIIESVRVYDEENKD